MNKLEPCKCGSTDIVLQMCDPDCCNAILSVDCQNPKCNYVLLTDCKTDTAIKLWNEEMKMNEKLYVVEMFCEEVSSEKTYRCVDDYTKAEAIQNGAEASFCTGTNDYAIIYEVAKV